MSDEGGTGINVAISALEVLTTDTKHDAAAIVPHLATVAKALEDAGYHRIWYAEHHQATLLDLPPSIMIAHAAAATSRIRVGSGGVLAPNHVPLLIGEQFRTLELLYPGRIDLGIGRGPGTLDPAVAKALRWGGEPATDDEYRAAVESVLDEVRTSPSLPQPWLLASSARGAQLAAELGLPLAFAFHIRPQSGGEAIDRYREAFKPSVWCSEPRVQVSVSVICADTPERAAELARPVEITRAWLLTREPARRMPDPEAASHYVYTAAEKEHLPAIRANQIHGTPDAVAAELRTLVRRFAVDELMIVSMIVDPDDRRHSYELVARSLVA